MALGLGRWIDSLTAKVTEKSTVTCDCGCGEFVSIAPVTMHSRGWVRGEPVRFVRGHAVRGRKLGPHPPDAKTKLRGSDHHAWAGDEIGYRGIHLWVQRLKKKTGKCSTCSFTGRTEWANISGVYLRDLEDYVEMCKQCHMELDHVC